MIEVEINKQAPGKNFVLFEIMRANLHIATLDFGNQERRSPESQQTSGQVKFALPASSWVCIQSFWIVFRVPTFLMCKTVFRESGLSSPLMKFMTASATGRSVTTISPFKMLLGQRQKESFCKASLEFGFF
jgi:hypothetical protein